MNNLLRFITPSALALALASPDAKAQTAVGEWAAYQSFGDATEVETHGNLTFCLSNGNLYSFDTDDNSIETYNKINRLNDNRISTIAYAPQQQTLIIVYDNSNIDLLTGDGATTNIADLMQSTSVTEKNINDITIHDGKAYLAGGFGIMQLDLKRQEISNTYLFDSNVRSVAVKDNVLYAATDDGVCAGEMDRNLLDQGNWTLIAFEVLDRMATTDDGRMYGMDGGNLYRWNDSGQFERMFSETLTFLTTDGDRLLCGRGDRMIVVTADGNRTDIGYGRGTLRDISYNARTDTYWCACGSNLLNGFKADAASGFTAEHTSIAPDGPRHELFYFMKFFGTDLYITGGMLNYPDVFNPGTVMRYSGGRWSYLEENLETHTGTSYFNTTSVALDPRDETHIFATSSFGGLYEFCDDEFVNLYTYYADPSLANSTLTSTLPNEPEPRWYVRTDGLNYDSQGNLWMVNSGSQTIINVMKADGTWRAFDHPEIANAPTVDRMLIDSAGRIWITLRRKTTGIFCFDNGGTVDDTSDDQTKFISTFINQDGESLGGLGVYCVAEDRDGTIWVGTTGGPYIINNPTRIFIDGTPQLTQIKVPRNDGTNLADFLLKDETIMAIVVDGANRKWIGTQNTGVYLVSADGLEMIEHFNTDNSPMPSNYVQSMAINPETGELFIGTDQGLVSYRTDSSEPEAEFDEDIYAFPNPVEPGYQGMITVTGLVYDTDIKITNTAGHVVAAGKSHGGTFAWDGKDAHGHDVATGIYFVIASSPDGKSGIATKIAVIR